MTAIPRWTERPFQFDFPVSLYQNVMARFRGTPTRLEDSVRGLTSEMLVAKPDGKWSIQENAGHLLDEEPLFLKRLNEFLAGAETLTPAPYKEIPLTHNSVPIEQILTKFRAARSQQVNILEGLTIEFFSRSAWHARLKVHMRLVDHLLFISEHDDHHLARIWELRRKLLTA